jgi:hypothetical protein
MGLLDSLKGLFGGGKKEEEAVVPDMAPPEAPVPAPTDAPVADLGGGDLGATPEVTEPVA